ncbi:YfmQ family protein [Niallia sp.]|uniref:YfmQ family protein n=1 Tax=Niallia sp. TaxID=2837523 RepID=UPI00289BA2CB|nr:YfmQ family protein [Niallia sp.]
MTWISIIALTLFCIIKVLMTCLPTGVVDWLLDKYRLHLRLNELETEIIYNEMKVDGENKNAIIKIFNEAIVREKYSLYPGSEETYLSSKNAEYSLVINTKKGNKDIKLFLNSYQDHVDIVKRYKNKIVAYSTYPLHLDVLNKK